MSTDEPLKGKNEFNVILNNNNSRAIKCFNNNSYMFFVTRKNLLGCEQFKRKRKIDNKYLLLEKNGIKKHLYYNICQNQLKSHIWGILVIYYNKDEFY